MATIRPFSSYRPKTELVPQVSAPPYDVVNTEEARKLAEGNPLSFLRVSRSEIELPPETDPYSPLVYQRAAENLQKLIDQKVLVKESSPCLYLYTQRMGNHVQTGLVTVCSVDDYDNDVIKKHEKTRKDKEDDRATHVITLKANTGPVFILYPDQNQINQLIADEMGKTPEVSFTSMDGIQHTVRVIRDAVVMQKLVGAFKEKVPTMYIADGHHRAASGSRARQTFKKQGTLTSDSAANYFMAVLFPASQLQILAYNRVVKDLNGLSPEDFLARVKEKFEVKEREEAPELKAGSFGMYLNKKWLLLSAKKGSFDAANVMKSLDVSILQDNLLGPTLGIDDPRTNKRIDFVGGIRGTAELMRLVDSGKAAVAFSLHPTTVKQLMAISDQGLIMPPKSTWFEPKLKSGLFLHRFE